MAAKLKGRAPIMRISYALVEFVFKGARKKRHKEELTFHENSRVTNYTTCVAHYSGVGSISVDRESLWRTMVADGLLNLLKP